MSDAPIVYTDNNNIYYRASALGSCLRALWAARSNFTPKPPPPALQKVFDEGHFLEPTILALLVSRGWKIWAPQKEVTLHVGTIASGQQLYVIGHVDALGQRPTDPTFMPVDAKAFSQSTMDSFLGNGIASFPHYAWQQSVYAIALGREQFCLPLFNKETEELTIKVYDSLPYNYEDIQDRVFMVEGLYESTTDPTTIDCPGSWGCPFHYLHDAASVDSLSAEQQQMALTHLALKRKIDTLSTARSTIGSALQSSLNYSDGLRTFNGEGVQVTVVSNPKRFNQQKAKEVLTQKGEDVNDYYIESDGESIRVKEKP
jgi:hypothetical protein